jgi:hypothetical protein
MSLEATLERVSAIRQALVDPAALIGSGQGVSGGTQAPSPGDQPAAGQSSFADALEQASSTYETPAEGSQAAGAPATLEDPEEATVAGLTSPTGISTPTVLAGPSALGSAYGLQSADGVVGASPLTQTSLSGASPTGSRIVAIAESQLGQTEQPPGSNESPAIAMYRSATAGSIPGEPWCAYFASWVARQAGEPIGEDGQGAGAVSDVWSWAQSTGRAIPNGPGVVPKPGDLIVFGDEHVGIVRDVLPSGQIQTIEGNYENKVAANVRTPTEATGYVEMG